MLYSELFMSASHYHISSFFGRLLESADDNFRGNTGPDDPSPPDSSTPSSPESRESQDPYEFIAFLLWYIFLVLCCILPTCCAYRRRRLLEQRILEQQEMHRAAATDPDMMARRFELTNRFILSNYFHSSSRHTEFMQQERRRIYTRELQATTFEIKEDQLIPADSAAAPTVETSPETHDNDYYYDEEEGDFSTLLVLPTSPSNRKDVEEDNHDSSSGTTTPNQRTVPGLCTVCLTPYQVGDKVTYSTQTDCLHCYHSDCIIPWLLKKESPHCPICRQNFCTPIQSSMHQDDASHSFSTATGLSFIPLDAMNTSLNFHRHLAGTNSTDENRQAQQPPRRRGGRVVLHDFYAPRSRVEASTGQVTEEPPRPNEQLEISFFGGFPYTLRSGGEDDTSSGAIVEDSALTRPVIVSHEGTTRSSLAAPENSDVEAEIQVDPIDTQVNDEPGDGSSPGTQIGGSRDDSS